MLVRQILITVCVVSATLLGLAACAPAAQSPDSAAFSGPSTDTETNTATEAMTEAATEAESVTSNVQSSEEGNVVDETPMSGEESAAASPGQSDPGAAAGQGSGTAPGAASGSAHTEPMGSGVQAMPGEVLVYADSAYGFSVAYPTDFVFRTEPVEKLADLEPRPVASLVLMNPTLASSDIAELEPADLEIRVHPVDGAASLQDWLAAHGFLGEGNLQAQSFQDANVAGFEVCASTMIAPGCSYFVLGDGWVYQMVPASIAGEAIARSFALVR